ncbi:hypothetical protein D0Z00_002007 [Geotrichum galactomycetum]|uniref:Uncharacterized protein n=1 Tax=Geotrichum galactomycetum TaxID=27317 RepID=A0ACB6V5H7_9ASCO|nr:hypothetical protein D0Z00_002007 [Geotrichum candidum]
MFGNNNSGSAFGGFGANKPATGFGSGFGASNNNNNNNSIFGQNVNNNANTTSSAFGASSSGSAFGASNNNPTSSFGGGGGGFGSGGNAFGSNNNANSSGGGLFGSKPATSSFGGFGSSTTNSSSPFGSSTGGGGFGANVNTNQPTNGTTIPFNAHTEKDLSPGPSNGNLLIFQTISAMPAYLSQSLEELRYQDYQQNRRYGDGNTNNSGFGSTNTASPFGSNSNTAGGFGSSSPFGANNNPQTGSSTFGSAFGSNNNNNNAGGGLFGSSNNTNTSAFGSSNSTFGASKPGFGSSNTGGGFGSNTGFGSGNTSAFGTNTNATANKPAFGFGSSGTSAFGSNTNNNTTGGGLFGNTNANNSSPFGQNTNNAGSAFGAAKPAFGASTGGGFGSTFGSNNNANNSSPFGQNNTTGGGLFGQNNTNTSNTGGGLFGQNNNTTNTGGGLFGNSNTSNQPSGGLFGNKPAGTTGGLFGNNNTSTAGGFGNTNTGGGLFGNNNATTATNTSGGLFGTNNNNTAGASTFGSNTTTSGGLFGNKPAGTTGGLFGSNTNATNTGATPGGGLFGNNNASTTTGGTGLFGNNNTAASTGGGLFGKPAASTTTATTGGLFGAKPAGTGLFGNTQSTTSTFGGQTGTGGGLFGNAGTSTFGNNALGTNTTSGLFSQNKPGMGLNTNNVAANNQQLTQPSSLVATVDQNPYGNNPLFFTDEAIARATEYLSQGPMATPLTTNRDKNKKTSTTSAFRLTPKPLFSPARRTASVSSLTPNLRALTIYGPAEEETSNGTQLALTDGSAANTSLSSNSLFGSRADELLLSSSAFSPRQSVRRLIINRKSFPEKGATSFTELPSSSSLLLENGKETTTTTTTTTTTKTRYGVKNTILPPDLAGSNASEVLDKSTVTPAPLSGAKPTSAPTLVAAAAPVANKVDASAPTVAAEGVPAVNGKAANGKAAATANGGPIMFSADTAAETDASDSADDDTNTPDEELVNADGYWMSPSAAKLAQLPRAALKHVESYRVGRKGYGQIEFLAPVDLASLLPLTADLITRAQIEAAVFDNVIVFVQRACALYPDAKITSAAAGNSNGKTTAKRTVAKPPAGEGLHVPALISLEGVWPVTRDTREPVKDPRHRLYQLHLKRLQKLPNQEFVAFEPTTGTWVFKSIPPVKE